MKDAPDRGATSQDRDKLNLILLIWAILALGPGPKLVSRLGPPEAGPGPNFGALCATSMNLFGTGGKIWSVLIENPGFSSFSTVDLDVEIMTMGNPIWSLMSFVSKCLRSSEFVFEYITFMYVSIHFEYLLVCLNTYECLLERKSWATKIGAYPSKFQPVNSALSPSRGRKDKACFISFSTLGLGLAPFSPLICVDVDVESHAHDSQLALRST